MSGRNSNHGTENGAGHESTRERINNPRTAASITPTSDQQQQQQEQEQELAPLPEIDNATHIVVEHHRAGTVRTHVYCSKDGKPSLLGHEIPDTTAIANNSFKEVFESGLEDKMKALKTLVKDSLDQTTKASLDTVDSLKLAVVESEERLMAQVSLATTNAIEQQIKTDVVPKLDSIERLLLAGGVNRKKESSVQSGTTSPHSEHSGASLEPFDRRLPPDQEPPGENAEADEEPNEHAGANTTTAMAVLERLSSQMDDLCRVVIDGDTSLSNAQENLDPEMAARVEAMQEQLLSMSEPEPAEPAQPPVPDRIDELLQMVTRNQETLEATAAAATELTVQQEQTRKEDDEAWKTSLKELLASHQTGPGGFDANLLALENGFKNMDAGFQDWTKTHRMSLNVYLKYMYMVFKSTKGVEIRIESALEDVRAQALMEPERRAEFSNYLQAIRSDIFVVLSTLPESIVSAMKRSQEPVIPEGLPEGREKAIDSQPLMDRSGPGSDSASLAPVRSIVATVAVEVTPPDADVVPVVEAELPKSDPAIERLVLTVESIRASIASMVEKNSELVAPPTQAPMPTSRDIQDSVIVDPEAPEPPPREPTVGDRLRAVEEQLATAAARAATAEIEVPIEFSVTAAGRDPVRAPLPPLPIQRGNPNPGPSPGYLGQSESAAAFTTAAAANASDPYADESKTEIVEEQGPSQAVEEITAAAFLPPRPDFLEELESVSKSLTELLHIISEGQTHMHQEMQREFLRVIHTIKSSETEEDRAQKAEVERRARIGEIDAERFQVAEEKRIKEEQEAAYKAAEERTLALDRISMIPNLMNSLEGVNYHLGQKSDNATAEIRERLNVLNTGTAVVEGHVVACLNKVQLIVDGNIQDSSVLNEIKYQIEEFDAKLERTIRNDDDALKVQVAEAIKKTEDVIVLVEDVKKISEKSLSVQEELQKQIGEWHQKQDEGIEALGIKHGESWEVWHKKHDEEWQAWKQTHEDSIGNLINLHDRKDLSFLEHVEARRGHHEELQGWHKIHDDRLEELERHRCHCCMPEPLPDSDPAVEADGQSVTGGTAPCARTIDCCGGDVGDINPCTRRVRELLEEFLKQILPGYGPETTTVLPHSTSGAIASELRDIEGTGVEGDPTEDRPTSPGLSFTTRNTSGVIVPEPSIHATTIHPTDSLHPDVIPRGEAATYHGAVDPLLEGTNVAEAAHVATEDPAEGSAEVVERSLPTPSIQVPLPQALYDLLRPFFHPESDVLVTRTKELEDLQSMFKSSEKEWQDNEDRLLTTIKEQNREIGKLRQRMDQIRVDLDSATQETLNLCKMGLGLKPDLSRVAPAPAVESSDESSDNASEHSESPQPEMIPHLSLMSEASASLRQALDETSAQRGVIHEEISMLENKKELLLQEVAILGRQCFELSSTPTPVAAAAIAPQVETVAEAHSQGDGPETREPVDDDHDPEYVTEDENGRSRGRGSRANRSRPQSVLGGNASVGGVSITPTGNVPGSRANVATSARSNRDQKRQAVYRRGHSRARAMESSSLYLQDRVPQLEADVKICQDGVQSETLLSSKTVLTDEQFERIRSSRAEAGIEQNTDDVWSLKFDVRVKMVPNP
ncbi:hypothetical protein KI688_012218 [Linnemannia hyalina]|uniref:Uncharacterized protein n=1 Tax=Linnemannia hyalina TaxID=64524 RepID=A0A9P8BTA1_9FUNG|nr:hypothetical protein KI688_012218 [Linnemannia hyalina]